MMLNSVRCYLVGPESAVAVAEHLLVLVADFLPVNQATVEQREIEHLSHLKTLSNALKKNKFIQVQIMFALR
jgi:hypothetical protein